MRDLIVRLLGALGDRREVERYLAQYADPSAPAFMVIKVGGAILATQLDELANALSLLHELGARPVVIHGAGPQLNRALVEKGIQSKFKGGHRVTTPEVLEVARQVFSEQNLALVEALIARGAHARPITSELIDATQDDALGLVGVVDKVKATLIHRATDAGHIPVIAPLGQTPSGQTLNINADVVTHAVAHTLAPRKVVFLTGTGGLLDERGQIISAINLREDFARLMASSFLRDGMRLKLEQIQSLLELLPQTSSVSITRPAHLARELFTHKGSGTLVRTGEHIERHPSFQSLDTRAIAELLASCFGRPLVDDYFERKRPSAVYVADQNRAVAIITDEVGVPYLDKFAVTRAAQGAGVGASLWHRMLHDHPSLVWRSRANNPINGWYFQQADGAVKRGEWVVFFVGLDEAGLNGRDTIDALVERVRALPATLVANELAS